MNSLDDEVEWLGIKMPLREAIHAEHMDNPFGRIASDIIGQTYSYPDPVGTAFWIGECPVCGRKL